MNRKNIVFTALTALGLAALIYPLPLALAWAAINLGWVAA